MQSTRRGASLLVVAIVGGMAVFLCLCLVAFAVAWDQFQERSARPFPTVRPLVTRQPPATAVVTATPAPAIIIEIDPSKDEQTRLLSAIYQKVNPSVVNITVRQKLSDSPGEEGVTEGQGSGFVWDKQGHIVTNYHVVAGADEVDVTFANDVVVAAQVIGVDPDSDLAVVKVDIDPGELIPAELGDSDTVQVGARAIAIGNPFGYEGTMTMGIVSAVGRSIPAVTGFQIPEAIQTDAAINPGNSGGLLLDAAGRVIGINAQIRSTVRANSGVGFAIPINLARRVVPALIETGRYEHAWLGISGTVIYPSMARDLGLPAERGVLIAEVLRGGPAARAGLRPGQRETTYKGRPLVLGGDIIVQIDDQVVNNFDDLLIYLTRKTSPGQEVTLTIWRGNDLLQVPVTLQARPRTVEP